MNDNILKPFPQYNTKQFSWHASSKTLTAEASDLNWPHDWPKLGQVFKDAIDEGFTLVSERTGNELTVVIDEVDRDEDYSGGWRAISFRPAERAKRDLLKVVVFND
jgi:hypothetical protein